MKFNGLLFALSLGGLAFICVCSPFLLAQPSEPVNWKDRLFNEAPKAWARFNSRASRLQGSMSVKATSRTHKGAALEVTMEFKQAPRCALTATQKPSSAKGEKKSEWELSAANSRYRFKLHRLDGFPWKLSDVSTDLITEPQPNPSLSVTNWVKGCVAAPVAINYNLKDDWPAILSSSDFTLLSVAPVEERGIALAKVDFEVRWVPSTTNLIRVVDRGRVWFDPQHCWVMRKCDYKMQRGPKGVTYDHSATYDYEIANDEFPFLKQMIVQNINSKGETVSVETTDFSLALADVPEKEFTLSAFGLPEPHGVVWPKPTRWWLWITLAAVGSVGLAVLYAKLKRRFDRPAPVATKDVDKK